MAIYVGYDLDNERFRDECGDTVSEAAVRQLWDAGELDATMMVQRLITQCNWDAAALKAVYSNA